MNQEAEDLLQYLAEDPKGRKTMLVPEGLYKGWVPRNLYDTPCLYLSLPFLKLLSFPVGSSSLGKLVDMESFNATGNYLSRLPESFVKCQNLVSLNLSFNHFESIPSAVFKLVNLVDLDMSSNDLADINAQIGELKQLKRLNLSGNLLYAIPDELANCKELEQLDLSRKWYPRGGILILPTAVCQLRKLLYFNVSWHQIHTIPDEVEGMGELITLKMKGNFLKHVSEKIVHCKKLQYLDLTGAMKLNSKIPENIFSLTELQILDLTNNYFTEISPQIVSLKKLRKLIMRRNAVLRLQDELFELESLESLDFSENDIAEIPACIKDLKTLKFLYLGSNKITSVPDELCECENLVELQLQFNQLTSLPDNIHRLSNLEELNLENNPLKHLPLLLDKLDKLVTTERLSVYNNMLTKPPQAICDQGVAAMFAYLKDIRICEASHCKKLILIGASKAGKTSLRNALLLGKSKLTLEQERTWVMEQHLWEPEADLRVQVLDFGGHHIYSAAHHMFLSPEALHVLVFDLTKYTCTPEEYNGLVGDWIEAISDRAPGAVIMIVGTHADLCDDDEVAIKTDDVLRRMHEEEQGKMAYLSRELARETEKLNFFLKESGQKFSDLPTQCVQDRVVFMQKMKDTRVTLPTSIFVVSCAEKLQGINNFLECLVDQIRSKEAQPLPRSWFKFLSVIQEKEAKILSWEETLKMFISVVDNLQESMYRLPGSAESSLEIMLKYLHQTGEIVWYHDNPKMRGIVFHHPETLVEMLRAIFRHDFKDVVKFVQVYGNQTGLTQKRFTELKNQFLLGGLMTQELLEYVLLHFSLSTEARDIFTDLMLKFDLCYEVQNTHSAIETIGSQRVLQFPWFLTPKPPADFVVRWPVKTPVDKLEMRYQLQFSKKSPPNFFEKLSSRLQSYVTSRTDWKDGVVAYRNDSMVLIQRSKVGSLNLVSLSIRGDDLQELWFLLLKIRYSMTELLQEWPFVRVEANLVCPHCILTGREKPYMFHGDIVDLACPEGIYKRNCPLAGPDPVIPACLVYHLDPELPAKDMDKHNLLVTKFLKSRYDHVDSGSILSDIQLKNIAAQLGFEWTTVALHLDLSQQEIEHIQMDNPNQSREQIYKSLLEWRNKQRDVAEQDKIRKLLEAISSVRKDLAEDLKMKFNLNIELEEGLLRQPVQEKQDLQPQDLAMPQPANDAKKVAIVKPVLRDQPEVQQEHRMNVLYDDNLVEGES